MKGCLSLPFRLLFLALLVVGGYFAWSHRDELRRRIHEWTADAGPAEPSGPGDAARGPQVRRKLQAFGSGGSDSVVLRAGEVADLLAEAAEATVAGALDSLEVRLERDEIGVTARLDTRRVPIPSGPLSGIVRERERIELGGPLVYRRAGLAEWQVTRVRVRGIPLPRELVGRLLKDFGVGQEQVLPVPLPAGVGGLRVRSGALVLYSGRSGAGVP